MVNSSNAAVLEVVGKNIIVPPTLYLHHRFEDGSFPFAVHILLQHPFLCST